jgi:glycosyltransferase involved in cell wall biosynthesis
MGNLVSPVDKDEHFDGSPRPERSPMPRASVLVTVYNGMPYILETLAALKRQTLRDFEVVVVDDGSTDGTPAAVAAVVADDDRFRLLEAGRIGRGPALNFGMARARAEFVAINDADDISLPERLERQVAFLSAHADHGLVGTYFETFSESGGWSEVSRHPTENEALRRALTRGPCLQHSAIMFRRSVVDRVGGYDEGRSLLYDRCIIVRVASCSMIATIPDVLVRVRHHERRYFYFGFRRRRRAWADNALRWRAAVLFKQPLRVKAEVALHFAWDMLPNWMRVATRRIRGLAQGDASDRRPAVHP